MTESDETTEPGADAEAADNRALTHVALAARARSNLSRARRAMGKEPSPELLFEFHLASARVLATLETAESATGLGDA